MHYTSIENIHKVIDGVLIDEKRATNDLLNKYSLEEISSDPEGFAQHLANALGKPVYAPNNTIYSHSSGKYWIANVDSKTKGEFIKFVPGGIKHGRK